MDEEMQKALEADGEKLRQLTGEDHGPVFVLSIPPSTYLAKSFDPSDAYRRAVALSHEPVNEAGETRRCNADSCLDCVFGGGCKARLSP